MSDPSTSFSFHTENLYNSQGGASPQKMLDFLEDLVTRIHAKGHSPFTLQDGIGIASGVSLHFLQQFSPPPEGTSWTDKHESVRLAQLSLQFLSHFVGMDGVWRVQPELVLPERIFGSLVCFYYTLGKWETDLPGENIPSPKELRERTIDTLQAMWTSLACPMYHATSENSSSGWITLQGLSEEVVRILTDLMNPATQNTYPLDVELFEKTEYVLEAADEPFYLPILASTDLPLLLADLLYIHIRMLPLSTKYKWCSSPWIHVSLEWASTLFEYFISEQSPTTSSKRMRALVHLGFAVSKMEGGSGRKTIEQEMVYTIVRTWLHDFVTIVEEEEAKAKSELEEDVGSLLKLTEPTDALLHLLFDFLKGGNVDGDKVFAVNWLNTLTSNLSPSTQQYTRLRALYTNVSTTLPPTLVAQLSILQPPLKLEDVDPAPLSQPSTNWRTKTRQLLESTILVPDELDWMDDDDDGEETFEDEIFVYRVLREVQKRFGKHRELHDTSSEGRIKLVKALSDLAKLLIDEPAAKPLAPVPASPKTSSLDFLRIFVSIFELTIQGSPEEVTSQVRQAVLRALSVCILQRRENGASMDVLGERILNIVFPALGERERGVRMSAGTALAAYALLCGRSGPEGWNIAAKMFARLDTFYDQSALPVRETLLIAIGNIGKQNDSEVLGHALCFLITHLGTPKSSSSPNILLKGLTYLQIQSISSTHNKKLYALVLPHLTLIAPCIVMQPTVLHEFCLLSSLAPRDFLSTTLSRTLPGLFARVEENVLNFIKKEVGLNVGELFRRYPREILAEIFLVESESQTKRALDYLVKVFSKDSDSNGKRVGMEMIVKSSLVELLSELVAVLGRDVKQGLRALQRLEATLAAPRPGQTVVKKPNPSSLLKQLLLGVIADINDMLQDVHGKKNLLAKRAIIRSLGELVELVKGDISNVGPQVMATFQTMIQIPELSDVTLESWYRFLGQLSDADLSAHVGATSASIVSVWPSLDEQGRRTAVQTLEYLVLTKGHDLGVGISDVVDLSGIPALKAAHQALRNAQKSWTQKGRLYKILERAASDNVTVAIQALTELHSHMTKGSRDYIRELSSGDVFDPLVGEILVALFAAAGREGFGTEKLRHLALQSLSVLGAVDPDRCEMVAPDPQFIVLNNFADEDESIAFALHLISDLLVGAFRSTSDIRYQSHLAYSIQELLKFCGFKATLLTKGNSIPVKVRNRWAGLSKHVLETVTPLVGGHFAVDEAPSNVRDNHSNNDVLHPIYIHQLTYREWIQMWSLFLISRTTTGMAKVIFDVFKPSIRNKDAKDVTVAHHILPHLVLNVLVSGTDADRMKIHQELLAVLEDQVNPASKSTRDKRLLSAQAVFNLLDHLNQWVRKTRQMKHKTVSILAEYQVRVTSVLANINEILMARAALQCKSYPRALMNFEQQIVELTSRNPDHPDLNGYYEKLHEIYAHLDEPDGMEGISTMILAPSVEHQIRQHESTGKWTSAQSCWELRLQQSPDNVEFHIGLLRCLRNLGHYDTLRTHVQGVLTRKPQWEAQLAGFHVESAWMIGAWDEVQSIVSRATQENPQLVLARLLLSLKHGNNDEIKERIEESRAKLGAPILASGHHGIHRSYDALLDLHLVHDLELVHAALAEARSRTPSSSLSRKELYQLNKTLQMRLDATLPTFRTREPILSMRRTIFSLFAQSNPTMSLEIGKSWLASAKIARTASQWQTAYSAMLQAEQTQVQFAFIQSAKLLKATGEPLRALQELENAMRQHGLIDASQITTSTAASASSSKSFIDLTQDLDPLRAKAHVLRARWMHESQRYEVTRTVTAFKEGKKLHTEWEGSHFYMGKFLDDHFKELSEGEQLSRGTKMNTQTARHYAESLKWGSKHVLLTIWLDWGETRDDNILEGYHQIINEAIKDTPVYKWYTAFPQIVSRIGHNNPKVYAILSNLMLKVLREYPKQGLWFFMSAVKSKNEVRQQRGIEILDRLQNTQGANLQSLVQQSRKMTEELLILCDAEIDSIKKGSLRMSMFPNLAKIGKCDLIIPLQQSLTASLPPAGSKQGTHKPFPSSLPTFNGFAEEIEVMESIARPRKIGSHTPFLGKPKDDLRKDARLMDFNSIINKLLKTNSDSRRRNLRIRTYGKCGFIQWVPNTTAFRRLLEKLYKNSVGRTFWSDEVGKQFKKIDLNMDVKQARDIFTTQLLPMFPPIFKEWFRETFPEPKAWFTARTAYGRTAAVMSMVGFILGLGDRHLENILFDVNTGDAVHVDFNCLFDKARKLPTPERVPFRLTQNIVDGLGVTGVEGVFRVACELTIQLLRTNKDPLLSVLDAFVHDPILEWEDDSFDRKSRGNAIGKAAASNKFHSVSKSALGEIDRKLSGVFVPFNTLEKYKKGGKDKRAGNASPATLAAWASAYAEAKPHNTSNLVQLLIQESASLSNLSKMYIGWGPHI
ncbi:hypothetical protein DL96DRAFT_1579811 [Flagelloscypha sp. PMI_526]|nr:hypothetical protein DL96DRAFT_1579811 [Flagelloscypha sp. PMI_526]